VLVQAVVVTLFNAPQFVHVLQGDLPVVEKLRPAMQLTGEKHFSGKGMRSLGPYETVTLFHAPAALNVEPSQTEGTCPIIVVELVAVTAPELEIL
jgi:hypothetical protein